MKKLWPLFFVPLLTIAAIAIWACAAAAALAAEPAEPPFGRDIIIGTVKKVSGGDGTNGDPPRVTFEITETLKGDLKGTIRVAWRDPALAFDYDSPSKGPPGWADQKVEEPKVGDSFILFGRLNTPVGRSVGRDGREGMWFYTTLAGRMTFTAENRDKAFQAIQFYLDKAEADAERRAARAAEAEAKRAEAVQRFRNSMTDERLTAAVQKADFVALAKFGRYPFYESFCSFEVTEVLKGRKRLAAPGPGGRDNSNFLTLEIPRDMFAELDPQTPCVVMLSEKGLTQTFTALRYHTFQEGRPLGDHVAFADDATVKRVRELTQGQAGKGSPAVLVEFHCTKFLEALEAEGGGKVAFIGICLTQGLDVLDKAAASRELDVDFLLNVRRGSPSGGSGKPSYRIQLARRGDPKTLLVDRTLPEVDEKALAAPAADLIAEILKAADRKSAAGEATP
jgi:hypothetical protein